VIIPLTTAQRKVFGTPFPGSVRLIMVQANVGRGHAGGRKEHDRAAAPAPSSARGQDNDFYLRNLAAVADSAAETTR
jgi:putative ABC transport system permease protein